MGAEQRESRDEHERPKESNSRAKKTILVATLAIVILIALALGGMHYTSQPNFCSSCHEITPAVASWSKAPHKDVHCLWCHSNPGTVGYVSRKLAGLGEVYFHFTGQIPQKIEAQFNIQTCIVCHTGKISDFPKAKNILLKSGPSAPDVDHSQAIAENISCLECHANVGHGQSGQ